MNNVMSYWFTSFNTWFTKYCQILVRKMYDIESDKYYFKVTLTTPYVNIVLILLMCHTSHKRYDYQEIWKITAKTYSLLMERKPVVIPPKLRQEGVFVLQASSFIIVQIFLFLHGKNQQPWLSTLWRQRNFQQCYPCLRWSHARRWNLTC